MTQQIVVIVLFVVALGYLGYRSWLSLGRPQTGGCAKGCGCETNTGPSTFVNK